MNSLLYKMSSLSTGQSVPFTGEWVDTTLCRNGLIFAYTSGSNITINVDTKTQFKISGVPDNVTFFSLTGLNTGYLSPVFFDSPLEKIRFSVPSGQGRVWGYINYQN